MKKVIAINNITNKKQLKEIMNKTIVFTSNQRDNKNGFVCESYT